MEILPERPSAKGPAEWFTGDVYFDVITRGEEPSRIRVNVVRFTPCARTGWHRHAVGQTLHVTEGVGRRPSGATWSRTRSTTSSDQLKRAAFSWAHSCRVRGACPVTVSTVSLTVVSSMTPSP